MLAPPPQALLLNGLHFSSDSSCFSCSFRSLRSNFGCAFLVLRLVVRMVLVLVLVLLIGAQDEIGKGPEDALLPLLREAHDG